MSGLDNEVYRLMRHNAAMARLVTVVQELSTANSLPGIVNIVRHAARELTGADGATFILRDGAECYYVDEDAVAPLWKGRRFPMEACVSGWSMLHGKSAIIEDIYSDSRVPTDAYRPTFVKSMAMVPIRPAAAIGAIGNYWAERHCPSSEEIGLLEALAGTVAVAMENLRLAAEQQRRLLEVQSAQRDAQLALEAAQLGRWDYDLRNHIYFWDARCREIFGFRADAQLTRETFLNCLTPSDRERMRAAINEVIESPQASKLAMQFQIVRADDGANRWLYSSGQAYFEGAHCVRFIGVIEDITDQKSLEQHLRLLVNELNHRVKNSLAVVQAIATQTFRSNVPMPIAIKAFSNRVAALAKTHDLLTEDNWSGTHLQDIAALIGEMMTGGNAARLSFSGPDVRLSPKLAVSLSLALHELATNAAKYGALSNETGSVDLNWHLQPGSGGPQLRVAWKESGGPRVKRPVRQGFGLRVLERVLPADLSGQVNVSFSETGLVCIIEAPLQSSGMELVHE